MNYLDIKPYTDVSVQAKRNLLIGNGFSVAICDNFRYDNLRSFAEAEGILTTDAISAFNSFETTDFELVLSRLANARSVNGLFGISCPSIIQAHQEVKDGLISVVNQVHPSWDRIDATYLSETSDILKDFDHVFSINYDLFLYWIMAIDFSSFTDYFFSSTLEFDQFNTDIWSKKTKVHYLHGALFLMENEGFVRKVRKNGSNIITSIGESIARGSLPLYVSEGSSKEKFDKIKSNAYLTFSYNCLLKAESGVVIIGASLSDVDAHISQAILKNNSLQTVAYGIYTRGKSLSDLDEEIHRIEHVFSRITSDPARKLEFFDVGTCPAIYDRTKFGVI